MIAIVKHGVILSLTDLGFENAGVLNPAVYQEGDNVHLFYRAVRKGNYSTIGYCLLTGPHTITERYDVPVLFPQADYEIQGVEDPRITKIDGLFYLTYTAYDGVNALGAYATADALPHFKKKGILTAQISYEQFSHLASSKTALNEKYLRYNGHPVINHNPEKKPLIWDKNVVFFPRRINGQLVFFHRIKPDIQIVKVNSMDDLTDVFWEEYFMCLHEHIALEPRHQHEISYIGAGCTPIETDFGWLIIYHGVHDTATGYKYVACAALMDLDNPGQEIARLPYELFSPEFDYEIKGEVNNVCFPTGTSLFGNTLHIYYGAADERIACASVKLSALLDELLLHKLDAGTVNHQE
jgi:beta-1,2-mannobiose phosphorylase / 1,2-beta-oligomannan phosphorylase